MMFFSNFRSLLAFIAFFSLWSGAACQEFDANQQILGLESVARGDMELGVGQQTLKLQPCVIRHSKSENVIQIVGWDDEVMRLYLELPGRKTPESPYAPIEPTLAMVQPPKPLSEQEESVYRSHDLSVIFEVFEAAGVKGRISGRVEDLMMGRTHEVRGIFDCRLEQPP